jgi:AcrR family transcriptional regulator
LATDAQRDDPRISRTRARALEVTLKMVAESGLHACTFDAVSEQSGIARSTLYRHWSNKSELVRDALRSQHAEHVGHDTGTLRDDVLNLMLNLGRDLETSTWGALVPHLVAAASTDPELSAVQRNASDHFLSIDVEIIERAKVRGEVAADIDPAHAALLFSAPIFYQYLIARRPADGKWITSHVDDIVALLRQR